MSTIKIGFSKAKVGFPIIAWLIMLCERVPFSHAYIRVRSESLDRDLIYQATGSGVYFIGLPAFETHAQIIEEYSLEVSNEAKKKMLQWAIDTSGKPYGKLQLVGIGFKRLCSLVGIKIGNPFKTGSGAYICTELAAQATEELGIPFGVDLDEVGLKELRDHVKTVCELQ